MCRNKRFCRKAFKFVKLVKSNVLLHSLYWAKRVTSWRGQLRAIASEQDNSFRRNVAAVASRWQHCVQFDRPKI